MGINKLEDILEEISKLEASIEQELTEKRRELNYTIEKGKVVFTSEIKEVHKKLKRTLFKYITGAPILIILTAPVIYSMIIPALVLDLFLSVYQWVCFPVYGIKKVKREQYIIMDRHKLNYLNIAEKINCLYCGYFNGLIAYCREVAARTEQYWCPIRHAVKLKGRHPRYYQFLDYGKADRYEEKLDALRAKLAEFRDV